MQKLEEALESIGLAATAVAEANHPINATIRPDTVALDQTLAATQDAEPSNVSLLPPRALPHLSVDLRVPEQTRTAETKSGTDLEVVDLLGEGGMGTVYLANQHSIGRSVAVKTARTDATQGALLVEGAVTGRLEHPAIVPVHSLGQDGDGRVVMVMKRVEGVAWNVLARNPTHAGWQGWPGDERDRLPAHLSIFMTVCNAVHFAHSKGVVHRDIKLENVLIGQFGDVYLADWGIAVRLGESPKGLSGTPGYMAPEMLDSRPVDARTDVYLLGASLHEVLTGAVRHAEASTMAALAKALKSEPHEYTSDVQPELAELINRACHVDPDQRPATAQALRDDVAQILSFRDAASLAAEAAERAERLHGPEELDAETQDRLWAEATFALERAYATGWKGNERAELARERLRGIKDQKRAHLESLEREATEQDPAVGIRQRAMMLAAASVLGFVVSGFALARGMPSPIEVVIYPAVIYAGFLGWLFFGRAGLGRTRFATNALRMSNVLLFVLVASRAFGLIVPTDPVDHFVRDSLMLSAGMGVAAVYYESWVGWLAVLFAASFVGCSLWPEYCLPIFGAASSGSVLIGAIFQFRSASVQKRQAS